MCGYVLVHKTPRIVATVGVCLGFGAEQHNRGKINGGYFGSSRQENSFERVSRVELHSGRHDVGSAPYYVPCDPLMSGGPHWTEHHVNGIPQRSERERFLNKR